MEEPFSLNQFKRQKTSPSARSGDHAVAGLPQPLTQFVGRNDDAAELRDLLHRPSVRLLTLVGAGGVGKTRLALRVAGELADHMLDGVAWVSLAEVRDPELVGATICRASATTLRSFAREDADPIAAFSDFQGILVLDNFEHVIGQAPLVASILAGCPKLKVLVTTRQSLNISGEQILPVTPFALPESHSLVTSDAGRLFIQRAQSRLPLFEATAGNIADLAGICRALDGVPLAIELAAAQIDVMSPGMILDRLKSRMPLLATGPIDAAHRHRTMDNAIGWSYDLLDERMKEAFRRLAVFVGGFALDAAEMVLANDADAMAMVGGLVARRLVVSQPADDGTSRFAMLETTREFALARLDASGEAAETFNRHAAWIEALAHDSHWVLFLPLDEGERRLARLQAEVANVRVALTWLAETGRDEALLRTVTQLGGLWVTSGHTREGARWIEDAFGTCSNADARLHASALATLSWVTNVRGNATEALDLAEQSLELQRAHGETMEVVRSLVLVGVAARNIRNLRLSWSRLREALAISQTVDHVDWARNWTITIWSELGEDALASGDLDGSESCLSAALDLYPDLQSEPGTSHVYAHQAPLGLGHLARARGSPVTALAHYRQVLALGQRLRNLRAITAALGGIAGVMATLGDYTTAARMFGTCEALHESAGFGFHVETFDRQRALGLPEPWRGQDSSFGIWTALHDAIGHANDLPTIQRPDEVAEAWAVGRALDVSSVISEALALNPEAISWQIAPQSGLTQREIEVLQHLAAGQTDREIAKDLFITYRTVATHVRHIYAKLDVSSRAEATAYAVRNGLA